MDCRLLVYPKEVHLIDCIFMDQVGSGGEFLELEDKWYMGTVHDLTSPYDIYVHGTR